MDPTGIHIRRPIGASGAVVFSSPHSGRIYPQSMIDRARLSPLALRKSEDAFVEELFAAAPRYGAPLIHADAPRAYVDLNRAPEELDPALIEGVSAPGLNPRLAAGLGVIPRVVAEGVAIYDGKLTREEAAARLQAVWRPYHDALAGLLEAARARHGFAVLVDCHSMPSDAVRGAGRRGGHGAKRPDVVLGDRFGVSCAPWLTERAERAFAAAGLSTARNAPFAGGYITQRYGRPSRGVHAIQIELDRGLYLDEARLEKSTGFEGLRRALEPVIAALSAADSGALAAE
ncbi:N-formylglutamate amidohydrolase [Rhodovulum sp. DZ06]|uniref:N-formylglutamate amidohydrolase n=1 Tax=Rhodovulum sp. DZ06 TaxID=3425126 RepID=UPI003D33B838